MDREYLTGSSVQENCCHSDTIQNAADTNVNARLTEEDEKSLGMETEKNSLLLRDEEKKSLNPGDEKLDEKKLYNHNEVETESTVDVIETRKENEHVKRDSKNEIDEIESKSKKSNTPEKSEDEINQTSESKTNEISESKTPLEMDRSDEGEQRSESEIKELNTSEHSVCCEKEEDSNASGEIEESSNENVLNASSENFSCDNEAITKNEEGQPIVNTEASEVVSDESELLTNGKNRDHISDLKDSPSKNEDENEDSRSGIDEERQEEKGTWAPDEVNIKAKSGGENVMQGEITPLKTYSEEEKVTCSGDHLKTSGEILKSVESNEKVTSNTENDAKEEVTLSRDDSEHGELTCNEDDLNSNKEILKSNDSEKVTSSDETDKQEETTPLKPDLEEGKINLSGVHLTSSEEKLKFEKSEKFTVTSSVETDQQEDKTPVQTDLEGENIECGDNHSNSETENLDEGHEGRKEKFSGHSEINKLVSSDESQSDDENHKDKKEGGGTTADTFSTGKDVENSDGKEAVGSDDIKEIIGENIVQNFDEDSFDLNINLNLSKSQDNSVTEFSAGMINNLKLPSHSDEKIYQSKVVLDRVDIEAASTPRKSDRRSVQSANKTSGYKSGQQSVSPTSGRRETRKRGLFSSTDGSPENKYLGLCAEDLPEPTVVLERVDIIDGAAAEKSDVQASDKSTRSQRKISGIHHVHEESVEDDHTRNFRKPGPRCATKRRQVVKDSADVPSRKSGRSSMSKADAKAITTSPNPGTVVNKGIHSTRSQYRNLKVRIDQSEWRKWREVANDEEFQPAVVVEQLSPDTTIVGQFFTQGENEASSSTDTRRSKNIHGTSASPQYQPKVVVDKLSPEQAAQHKFPFGDDTEASTSTGRKNIDAMSHDEPGGSKYQPRVMLDKVQTPDKGTVVFSVWSKQQRLRLKKR